MENKSSNIKRFSIVIIALGILGILFAGWTLYQKGALQDKLNDELLRSESLLSEKLLLDKEIDKFKREINELTGDNQRINNLLDDMKYQLAQKELDIKKMLRDNASITQLRKELAALKQMRTDYETQLVTIKAELEALNIENQSLEAQNKEAQNTIAQLKSDNEKLSENLEILTSMANNTLLEVTKKNQKLTINAKRARNIKLSFDVPASSYNNIDVRIIDPNEQMFTQKDGVTHKEILATGEATASIKSEPGASAAIKRLEVTYTSKGKLNKGIYKADVYNSNVFIGRVQVKLR